MSVDSARAQSSNCPRMSVQLVKRRTFIASAIGGVSLMLISGCFSNDDSGNTTEASPTSTPSATSTPTPVPPSLGNIDVTEVPDPRGLNPLGFQIGLKHLANDSSYRVRVSVTSEAGTEVVVFNVQTRYGVHAPLTGGKAVPMEETTTETTELAYRVVLIENGKEVDVVTGSIEYE